MANETTEATDRLLDTAQASNFLKLSPQTLATYRSYGKPPVFVKGRKKVYYKLSDLIRYADDRGLDITEGAII